MSNIICIKSIENKYIEFNKYILCYVSELLNDIIINMNDTDNTSIDENNPSLTESNLYSDKKCRFSIFELSLSSELVLTNS